MSSFTIKNIISAKYSITRGKMKFRTQKLSAFILITLALSSTACKAEEQKPEQLLSLPFLAVDLNGNGKIDTIPLEESDVYFDVDGDGLAERTEWISPEDGLVGVVSREEKRSLQSMHERLLKFFLNGLETVDVFDKNKDGVYDEKDYQTYKDQSFRDLGFLITKDSDIDGIPETHRNELIPCEFQSLNIKSTENKYKLSCTQKLYSVHKIQFSYDDTNTLWGSLCKALQQSRSQASEKEYQTRCADQE